MTVSNLVKLIKSVAKEREYSVSGSDASFEVFIDRHNAVAFQIKENSSGYLQVHQWEGEASDSGKYGRCVYSLRDYSDTVHFCNIMMASATVRARR